MKRTPHPVAESAAVRCERDDGDWEVRNKQRRVCFEKIKTHDLAIIFDISQREESFLLWRWHPGGADGRVPGRCRSGSASSGVY